MDRRMLIGGAGIAAAGAALPKPAHAQGLPEVRWRLASSYPRSLDTLFGAGAHIARRVAAMTEGRFQIQPFAAGEIVGPLQVLDSVQNGTVECGHTLASFYIGKDPAFAFEACLPFGLNVRQQNAWLYHGGGLELVREFLRDYGVHTIPAGNTGAQMGGWFRREIKTVQDLKGLKFRVAGIAGTILSRLGVVPQQIGAADIYPALERGTLDAAEFSGPYDDEKLGFHKVAKHYYYPGWWEGGPTVSLYVNQAKWAELPKAYQEILTSACAEANAWCVAKYDAENPDALRRLVGGGAELRPFPKEVMEAAYREAQALYGEIAAKNERFRRMYEHWNAFRAKQVSWFRVAELPFDVFVASQAGARG